MNHFEHSSFVVAAVISVTVHATAAVYLGHYDAPLADQPRSTVSVVQISLSPGKPAAPKPEPEPEPETPPEPEARPRPAPPPPAPVPEPEVRRKPLPEPLIEPPPASSEVPEKAELIEEQMAASAYAEAPLDTPALARVALENERESYLLRLLAHIDSHKFYPRNARRRGTEGEVQVSFHLRKDGNISNLQVTGGSRVLRDAAKQAVQRALSLPLPPESMPLQEQIRFGMVYRLEG
jgi:protein TonB